MAIDLDKPAKQGGRKRGGLRVPALNVGKPNPLSKAEAKQYRDKVIGWVIDACIRIDQGITITNREQAESLIWQSLTPDEREKIADSILALAQQPQGAGLARMIRGGALVQDSYGTGMILVTAITQSILHYVNHGGFVAPGMGALFGVQSDADHH